MWNHSAEWCKDRALVLIERSAAFDLDSIEKFAVKLRSDFENWAFANKKTIHSIEISTWENRYMGLDRPNSTERCALIVKIEDHEPQTEAPI